MVTIQEVLSNPYPTQLDTEFDGSCPCFHIQGDGFQIDAHCWRAHRCCEYSGIHVTGLPFEDAMIVGTHIALHNGWSGSQLTIHGYMEPQRVVKHTDYWEVVDGCTDWEIRNTPIDD